MGSLCIAKESNQSIERYEDHTEQEIISLAPPAPLQIEEENNSDDDKSVIGKYKATWTSLLISGYIRREWNLLQSLPLFKFPADDIILLIRSWCYFKEKIDEENSNMFGVKISLSTIDDELQLIECMQDKYGARPFHVFGTNIYTKGQRIGWRFRIKKHWGLYIGIIEANKIKKELYTFCECNEIGGYGLYTLNNRTYHNASVPWKKLWNDDCKTEDIIEMELDLTERNYKFGTLVFKRNGDDGGKIAFKGIVSNKEYKLAIAVRSMQSIALLKTQ